MFSRPPCRKRALQINDAGRYPPPRTPSGVFSCYPLVARSKVRQDCFPYSPNRIEGVFSEVQVSSRGLLHFEFGPKLLAVYLMFGG
jgi:hypothetical protein